MMFQNNGFEQTFNLVTFHVVLHCLDDISLDIWIYLDLLNRPGKQLQCHLELPPYNFINEETKTQRDKVTCPISQRWLVWRTA